MIQWDGSSDWDTAARDALIEAGAIRPCKKHFDIYIHTHDSEAERAAYAIGTTIWKVRKLDGPRTQFIEQIKDTLDKTEDTCYICNAAWEPGDYA